MKKFKIIAGALILVLNIHICAYAIDKAYVSNKSRDEASVVIVTGHGKDEFTLASRSGPPNSKYQITQEYTACIKSIQFSSTVHKDKSCKSEMPESSCHLKGQLRCAFTADYTCDCETYSTP